MKNVVISVSLNDQCINQLKDLKKSDIVKNAETVHFVHCFEIHLYTSDFSPYVYPTEERYPELEEASHKVLKGLAKEICSEEQMKSIQSHVFFTQSPKEKMRDFLEESKADLAIVATRGKHGIQGLFSSSFAEHLVKYSPCDILIVRPLK